MQPKKKAARKVVRKKAINTEIRVASLHVERKKLSALKPHARNPRTHPKEGSEEWETLRASLAHDYFDPIVWNQRNNTLVSGHLRRKVLMKDGVKEADVVVVDYDEHTHLARMIAANKLQGKDNTDMLTAIFGELGEIEEFDLSLTGFTLPEIDGFGETPEGSDSEDQKDEVDAYTKTDVDRIVDFFGKGAKPTFTCKPKQIWKVGTHLLYIGSVIKDHAVYVPLLAKLQADNPKKEVLFVPMPDPLMLGAVDPRAVVLFVQPSPLAASLALSLLKKKSPKHTITLTNEATAKTKGK